MPPTSILLLHGALGSANELEPLSLALREEGFEVFSLNFSGHAKKAFQSDFTIEQFSVEVQEFILQKDLKDVSLFGYSMGGYVALHLSLKGTVTLNKIITLGTKFNWTQDVATKERKNLQPDVMLQKIPGFVNSLHQKHGDRWKELVLRTADLMQDIADKNYLNDENLQRIKTDVLIGIADKDQMVLLEETLHVFKTLRHAAMYMLPKSKHTLDSIDPKLLASIIKSFLL